MSVGCVHTNSFSFGFVYGDAENGQRLSVDTAVFMKTKTYAFSFASTFESVFILMENAQRLGVDRRPKHIKVCAVSNENVLVWTGP